MSLSMQTLRDAIADWAVAAVDDEATTVYWAMLAAERPTLPAVMLNIIAGPTRVGQAELRDVADDPDQFEQIGIRTLVVSITAFGPTSDQIAADLITAAESIELCPILSAANLAVVAMSDTRNVSLRLETKFEPRTQFDLTLATVDSREVEPGVIERVHISGDLGPISNATIVVDQDDE